MEDVSTELLARWRHGDQTAAAALYDRYAERLRALARGRLSPPLARLFDPDDIVQSACRSFFSGVRAGRFVVQRDADLWRLLAAITLHKLKRQVERQRAAKRSHAQERHFGGESSLNALRAPQRVTATPSESAVLAETLEQALCGFEPIQRRMVELRIHGHSLEEIAAAVARSERTVRRILELVKERLQEEGLGRADW